MAKRSIIASELAPSDSQSWKGNWSQAHYDPHGEELEKPMHLLREDPRPQMGPCTQQRAHLSAPSGRCASCCACVCFPPHWDLHLERDTSTRKENWRWNPRPGWLLWPWSTPLWPPGKIRKTIRTLTLFRCSPIPSTLISCVKWAYPHFGELWSPPQLGHTRSYLDSVVLSSRTASFCSIYGSRE